MKLWNDKIIYEFADIPNCEVPWDREIFSRNYALTLPIFNDDDIAVVQFEIPAIHCSSCVWLLEKLDCLQKGVVSSQVNFIKKNT